MATTEDLEKRVRDLEDWKRRVEDWFRRRDTIMQGGAGFVLNLPEDPTNKEIAQALKELGKRVRSVRGSP